MKEQKKTVLVIEDDAEMALLLSLMFRQHRIRMVIKLSGEEGLAAMDVQKPDLVLLDIMMPGVDGWEVYQRMKASPELREVPIIIITAKLEWMARRNGQCFEKVVGYVMKPLQLLPFVGLVEHCLGVPPTTMKRDAEC